MSSKKHKPHFFRRSSAGFTFIESIVGIAVFVMLVSAVLGSYSILARSMTQAKERTILASQAAYYLELVRNMPYEDIGTANGNPPGSLADSSNPIVTTQQGVAFSIYYEVTYIDDPADGTILAGTDLAPTDYKQVKLSVSQNGGTVIKFLTNVAPEGLEGLSNAGALYIRSFDANGQPVANASVRIENTSLDPDIVLDRNTDSNGNLIEVGLPVSVNGYNISVTKNGYSTESTYPISVDNPNPVKPDATIIVGEVTQISFAIDLVSNLAIRTVNSVCSSISGVPIDVRGAKLIGTSPDVLKFENSYTSSGGEVTLNNIEWDNYVPILGSSANHTLYGTSPIQEVNVLPASNQVYTFVLGPPSSYSLRVIVKDLATGAALEGATVELNRTGGSPQQYNAITGGSLWQQLDWDGGLGQDDFINPDQYFTQDGFIDTTVTPTGIQLTQSGGNYHTSGTLESSTFDTGAASNFTTLAWLPTSQNPATEIKFQLATNNDNATWDFIGPDGTDSTYYSIANTNISASHDGDRYVRYKVFLSTSNDEYTPVLTSVDVNYVSGCYTPGQVIFPNLVNGNHDLTITMPGYATYSDTDININGNLVREVLMSP